MARKIVIDIRKDGSTNIEAFGYTGNACEKATQPFEEMLGDVKDVSYKNEYYEQATNTNSDYLNQN